MSREQALQVAENILGTCKGLDEVIAEVYGEDFTLEHLTIEETSIIDENVWECPTCGWWVEPCQMATDDACDECTEDPYNA